eukprot:6185239-Pleurochrysis_carterae.AAC.2
MATCTHISTPLHSSGRRCMHALLSINNLFIDQVRSSFCGMPFFYLTSPGGSGPNISPTSCSAGVREGSSIIPSVGLCCNMSEIAMKYSGSNISSLLFRNPSWSTVINADATNRMPSKGRTSLPAASNSSC